MNAGPVALAGEHGPLMRERRAPMHSSLPPHSGGFDTQEALDEVFRRLDDVAADLDRLDSRLRPYGDGESDLQTARWARREQRSPRGFPLTRVGDGR